MVGITAVCAFFEEKPAMLEAMVLSLAGVADRLVCLDGPFAAYPHEAASSPPEQIEAITGAAVDAGLDCVVVDGGVFATQATKRSHLMRLGYEASGPDAALLVIDGDERVRQPIVQTLHDRVARIRPDVYTATVQGPYRWTMPRLFRAHPDLIVEGRHNGYRLNGGPWLADLPSEDLSDCLAFAHDRNLRSYERLRAAHTYRQTRTRRGER